MFKSKEKREAIRQQMVQEMKEALEAKLAQYLSIADPTERYLAVLDFKQGVIEAGKMVQKRAKERKNKACFWAGLAASAPIPIIWCVLEPFTGISNLVISTILGLTPGVCFFQDALKLTRIGGGGLKDAQAVIELADVFQTRADEALKIIIKNHLDELAASQKATDILLRSPSLNAAMTEAFKKVARKKLENPAAAPEDKQQWKFDQ